MGTHMKKQLASVNIDKAHHAILTQHTKSLLTETWSFRNKDALIKKKNTNKKTRDQGAYREVLLLTYLTGSAVKSVRQELQLSDRPDLRGHLNHSDQLLAV